MYGTESIISDEAMVEGNLNLVMLEQLKENGSLVPHNPSEYAFGEADGETRESPRETEEAEEEETEDEEVDEE